mmetsp:Transcript_7039/g.17334  ORF Transcript_7039/g.17334 Transcript_7039/m.17334 type:complete len:114 (+) Transcript_7039:605-946(+)
MVEVVRVSQMLKLKVKMKHLRSIYRWSNNLVHMIFFNDGDEDEVEIPSSSRDTAGTAPGSTTTGQSNDKIAATTTTTTTTITHNNNSDKQRGRRWHYRQYCRYSRYHTCSQRQ